MQKKIVSLSIWYIATFSNIFILGSQNQNMGRNEFLVPTRVNHNYPQFEQRNWNRSLPSYSSTMATQERLPQYPQSHNLADNRIQKPNNDDAFQRVKRQLYPKIDHYFRRAAENEARIFFANYANGIPQEQNTIVKNFLAHLNKFNIAALFATQSTPVDLSLINENINNFADLDGHEKIIRSHLQRNSREFYEKEFWSEFLTLSIENSFYNELPREILERIQKTECQPKNRVQQPGYSSNAAQSNFHSPTRQLQTNIPTQNLRVQRAVNTNLNNFDTPPQQVQSNIPTPNLPVQRVVNTNQRNNPMIQQPEDNIEIDLYEMDKLMEKLVAEFDI